MTSQMLFRRASALLFLVLMTVGCVSIPEGPSAEVRGVCGLEIASQLRPSSQCATVVASSSNNCSLELSILCKGENQGLHVSIKPGEKRTLCCPKGSEITSVSVACQGNGGNCNYLIVSHEDGAEEHLRCYR